MRRRRVTYRPSKAQGAFGVAVGVVFVIIGLVMVIPSFGPFGILWTLIAAGSPPPLPPRPTIIFPPPHWM